MRLLRLGALPAPEILERCDGLWPWVASDLSWLLLHPEGVARDLTVIQNERRQTFRALDIAWASWLRARLERGRSRVAQGEIAQAAWDEVECRWIVVRGWCRLLLGADRAHPVPPSYAPPVPLAA
jgi:hypothetical protein